MKRFQSNPKLDGIRNVEMDHIARQRIRINCFLRLYGLAKIEVRFASTNNILSILQNPESAPWLSTIDKVLAFSKQLAQ